MNRKFKPNRQGITLLFVISMIVLFLLMGTAFVVVSNSFKRASNGRIRSNVIEGKGSVQANQLLDEAIFQIIRGTDLREIDSPLRTNEILADQYGYGFKAFVSRHTSNTPSYFGGQAFIQFTLNSTQASTATPDNMGIDLRTFAPSPLSNGLNGTFGGRVLSFTSGPAKGFSARITADAFNTSGDALVFRIPATSISGDAIDFDPGLLVGSEVIINGRDFSGVGADAAFTAGLPTGLGDESQRPNRLGQLHSTLMSYLNSSNSVNEPWDAADIANPFLSGFSKDGTLLPSFRPINSTTPGSGRAFFHAFDEGGDNLPDVDTDGDGENDSFWMDLGMSIVTNAQGNRFRPLFAIHVRDLDGLLNVNAHGNRTHLRDDGFVATVENPAGAGGAFLTPRGSGMGTPEINISNAIGSNFPALLDSRYGADMLPGNGPSFRSRAKLFGHPSAEINNGGTVGNLFGTAMDIHGRFRIGTPVTTKDFLDINAPDFFNSSLPQIDILTTLDIDSFTDEFSGNAYEMSINGDAPGDAPFTVQELERILRPNDIDSQLLPDRLSDLLDDALNPRLFTSDSFDVPMLHLSFVEELNRILQTRLPSGTDQEREQIVDLINDELNKQRAFAPELYFGLKMDINRPFGDGIDDDNPNDGNVNSNGVVDEPGEEIAALNNDARGVLGAVAEVQMDLNFTGNQTDNDLPNNNPRDIYARNLYMLAMLLLDPIDLDGSGAVDQVDQELFAQAMAQWAVNVVDFRDPDSIHTRFVYDPTPFDTEGWNPTTNAAGDDLRANEISSVWGCERPELLITEPLAGHDRRTENLADGGTVGGGGTQDVDFDQRLRPEAFSYIELYNPWVQNSLNQTFGSGLYDNNQAVQLARVNGAGAPVWRFEVERTEGDGSRKPLRYVYMADPTGAPITYNDSEQNQVPADIEVFFPENPRSVSVRPGTHAVVGTRGFANGGNEFRTFLGRRKNVDDSGNANEIMLDTTTHLSLDANAGTLTRYNAISDTSEVRNTGIVFVDRAAQIAAGTGMIDANTSAARQFSLSDPYMGYDPVGLTEIMGGDGFTYDTVKDQPLDRSGDIDKNRNASDLTKILIPNGVSQDFRTIRLQRLANPLIQWDPVTNPYLTIDSMDADLVSFNGAHDPAAVMEPGLPGVIDGEGAVSHERGFGTSVEDQLWTARRSATPAVGTPGDMTHNFDQDLIESLGKTNDVYSSSTATFPWLSWNNRPFVSHMEIMNVPHLAPDQLTYAPEMSTATTFSIDDNASPDVPDPYNAADKRDNSGALAGRYGHLLNFFGGDPGSTAAGANNFANMHRLLDYIEVPSRFVGTESYYLTTGTSGALSHPFNTISHYRVPGKVNINTIPPNARNLNSEPEASNSLVWNALVSNEYAASPALNWTEFKNSLYGSSPTPTGPTDFTNPFRPAYAANLVPGVTDVISGSACTLVRPRVPTSATPLFDFDSTDESNNSHRSAAFRNGLRTRLGNMVTTKSSLFAGWVTVGYFEVDGNNELVDTGGNPLGNNPLTPSTPAAGTVAEIGAESGEQVRNRAFFIFDRSIPVAYEPGKNHNIDKAIRVKTIIQ